MRATNNNCFKLTSLLRIRTRLGEKLSAAELAVIFSTRATSTSSRSSWLISTGLGIIRPLLRTGSGQQFPGAHRSSAGAVDAFGAFRTRAAATIDAFSRDLAFVTSTAVDALCRLVLGGAVDTFGGATCGAYGGAASNGRSRMIGTIDRRGCRV